MEIKLGELGEVSFGILLQKVPEAEQHNDTGVVMIWIQYLLQYSTQLELYNFLLVYFQLFFLYVWSCCNPGVKCNFLPWLSSLKRPRHQQRRPASVAQLQ